MLIVSQVFPPDPAAVGQHLADVAVEMARRGHPVRVYAANRGYEDPTLVYAARENLHGVRVRRLPLSSFGKRRILTRLLGTVTFMLQTFFVTLFTPRLGGVFFSTSPPMIGFVVSIAAALRRVPVAYWAMDLNPDQLIALGKVPATSLPARVLERVNRFILRRAALVIALDRFMADRLRPRTENLQAKLLVLPPWAHEEHLEPVEPEANPFRVRHGLGGKFVVMYSGNHSPSNPLMTLLQAAAELKDDPRLRFLFVGGGLGKREVEAAIADHGLANVLSLPYQPLAEVRYSLSAADVHVVSLGDEMVGIIHPCKIYGAMTVSRPVLFFGPRPSHVSDLLEGHRFGWHVAHGDVAAAVQTLRRLPTLPREELAEMGRRARSVVRAELGQQALCGRLCDALESRLGLASARSAAR
jgi:glycosyltransferase involved in cell wall biosynthesis